MKFIKTITLSFSCVMLTTLMPATALANGMSNNANIYSGMTNGNVYGSFRRQ